MEEVAAACASTAAIWAVHISLASQSLLAAGTEEQKTRYLVPLAKGQKLGAFADTEPNAGSDAQAIETLAEAVAEGYRLNGRKMFITSGDVADTLVVFATTNRFLPPRERSRGIRAFIVEKDTPGFSVGKPLDKLGLRASSTAELTFDDCVVPKEQALGETGAGFKLAMSTVDGSRIGIAAQAIGIGRAALEACLGYAHQREQFGRPIAQFQTVQGLLAEMGTRIEAARLLTYQAASLKDRGEPFARAAAMAKYYASETAVWAGDQAILLHGGYGYLKDSPVQRYYRDAKATQIYEGTSHLQQLVIARHLLQDLKLGGSSEAP
jgi:butyryl-CoA dehydrogenase